MKARHLPTLKMGMNLSFSRFLFGLFLTTSCLIDAFKNIQVPSHGRPGRSSIKNVEILQTLLSSNQQSFGRTTIQSFNTNIFKIQASKDSGSSERKISKRLIPSFPQCVEDLAFEASNACLDMIQEQGLGRIRVEIKGGKLGEGDDFDRIVGQFIALMGNCGYRQTRVVFGSMEEAVSARPFLRVLRPETKLVVDILEEAMLCEKDELVLFVAPSNRNKWENFEKIQRLVVEGASNSTPMIMINPELCNYMRHAPLLLADFEQAFFFDRCFHIVDSFTSCGILKRYPRKWEMFIVNLHQGGYMYFREFNSKPTHADVVSAFQKLGKGA